MKKILGLVLGLLFTLPAFATDLNLCRNLVDEMKIGSLSGLDGSYMEADNRAVTKNFISVTPDTYYSFNVTGNDFFIYDIYAYDSNKTFLRSLDHPSANNVSVQIPSEGAYIKYSVRKNDNSQVTLNDFQTYMKLASCVQIQVATKKYNDTAFSPVVTALNSAITTIKSVVTNTINQAAAVSALQTGKQTMPNASATNGTCPNYKQCLLVETSDGTPQWFVITDPFRDFVTPILATNTNGTTATNDPGYQQVEYIQSDGNQYIDTGVSGTTGMTFEINLAYVSGGSGYQMNGWVSDAQIGIDTLAMKWWNMESGTSSMSYNTRYLTQLVIGATTSALYVDGVKQVESSLAHTHDAVGFGLFAATNVSGGIAYESKEKIYNARILNTGGTVIHNFVPVRRLSDSALGMYDTVSKTFFPNAGDGDFTAGPDVTNDANVPSGPTWSVTWSNNGNNVAGTVYGEGKCRNVDGTYGVAATATQMSNSEWSTDGLSCWCKATGVIIGQESSSVSSAPWVFNYTSSSAAYCAYICASNCASNVRTDASFRSAVFNTGS